jgi:hypothetical protein
MSGIDPTIQIVQAEERLRQERATFQQRMAQDRWWFRLRLTMGSMAVVLLPAICAVSAFVIFNSSNFDETTVTLAGGALMVDSLGLVIAVWRLVLGRGPNELAPVTAEPGEIAPATAP